MLSDGWIVSIVFGLIIAVLLVLIIVWYVMSRKKDGSSDLTLGNYDTSDTVKDDTTEPRSELILEPSEKVDTSYVPYSNAKWEALLSKINSEK